jgi:hypothetical protein
VTRFELRVGNVKTGQTTGRFTVINSNNNKHIVAVINCHNKPINFFKKCILTVPNRDYRLIKLF